MNHVIDEQLLQRFDVPGPRYTSYPTADRFVEAFTEKDYVQALEQRRAGSLALPLSLYVHIPFCESLCYYCACNKVITKHHSKAAEYLRYLSRKTQYLITHEKNEFIQRFWQHLVMDYHPAQILPRLTATERKSFCHLLQQFARDNRPAMRARYQKLEKKIPWLLQHPEGGYFIPFEIIKTLMPRKGLIPEGYLFQLLYAMPEAEQQSLRALLARSHRSREALAHEKHRLDRALALYIWTAEQRDKIRLKPPLRAKSVWQHLEASFPHQRLEIEEWQHIMLTGRKGFYRSLLLLRGAELLKRYVAGLSIVPVTTRRHRVFPPVNLKFVVPLEFRS